MAELLFRDPEIKIIDLKKFEKYFPQGKIKGFVQAPQKVNDHFLYDEDLYDQKDPELTKCKRTILIEHDNGDRAYLRTMLPKSRIIHIVEVREEEITGFGTLIKDERSAHVSFSQTEEEFRSKGLGARRLLLMNAVSRAIFDYSLRSGNIIDPYEKRLWEKFVDQKKAYEINGETSKEFSFL